MMPEKPTTATRLETARLILCTKCACHYLIDCTKHGAMFADVMPTSGTIVVVDENAPTRGGNGFTYKSA